MANVWKHRLLVKSILRSIASGLNVPFQSKQVRGNLEQLSFEVFKTDFFQTHRINHLRNNSAGAHRNAMYAVFNIGNDWKENLSSYILSFCDHSHWLFIVKFEALSLHWPVEEDERWRHLNGNKLFYDAFIIRETDEEYLLRKSTRKLLMKCYQKQTSISMFRMIIQGWTGNFDATDISALSH